MSMPDSKLGSGPHTQGCLPIGAPARGHGGLPGLLIREKEPPQRLELVVRKDRLSKITPIAIAQLAIKHNCECVISFFPELSKNLKNAFT